jgi:protocatechuate 4,5-dioxygenase alpha chain
MSGAADAARLALFGPAADLHGVVRYRGELAQRGYRLNSFLVGISQHGAREAYLRDEAAAMAEAGLSEHEQALVRTRNYPAMLAYGVNVYALAKAGYVFGDTLLAIGQGMRAAANQEQI